MFRTTDANENFNFLDTRFDTEVTADNLRWLWISHILRDEDNRLHSEELPQLSDDSFYVA